MNRYAASTLRGALPPEEFAQEVMEIERELTEIHPPWRTPLVGRDGVARGFVGTAGIKDDAVRARCKYLLQRRKHLYDGKNWQVAVTSYLSKDGKWKQIAHPIIPKNRYTAEDLRAAATRSRMPEMPKQATFTEIAASLSVSVEVVERLSLDAPKGANLLGHVRRKLREREKAQPIEVVTESKPAPKKRKSSK